jgi:ligand-binding sensor domain-containing protein
MLKKQITLIVITCGFYFAAFCQGYKYKHITVNEGLSQNSVFCMAQDSLGFIWIGSGEGLNRYDGYSIKQFRTDADDTNSLAANNIKSLCADKNTLWIGTRGGGLNYYDFNSGVFHRYPMNDSLGISSSFIVTLCFDADNNLWVATVDKGAYVIDTKTKKIIAHHIYNKTNANSIASNDVRAIACAPDGTMWIGHWDAGISVFYPKTKKYKTYNTSNSGLQHNVIRTLEIATDGKVWIGTWNMGVILFNPADNSFINNRMGNSKIKSIECAMVWDMYIDKQERVWIATAEDGLIIYNPKTAESEKCLNDKNNFFSLSDNNVFSLLCDKSGQIWAGTWGAGVNIYSPFAARFKHFYSSSSSSNSLSRSSVLSACVLKNGNVLFGHTNGVDEYNPVTKKFTAFPNSKDRKKGMPENGIVTSIVEDADGFIWMVVNGGGLVKYYPDKKIFEPIDINYCKTCVTSNNINVLFVDSKKNIWIGMSGWGINIIDYENKKYIYHRPNNLSADSLQNGTISAFAEDKKGNIWIASSKGLSVYNPTTKKFKTYQHSDSDKKSLSSNLICEIHIDKNDLMWVGTIGGGLNFFNPEKNEAVSFTIKDGLAGNTVVALLSDAKSNLWVATNSGLSKFNTETKEIKNYTQADGVQSNEFNRAAAVDEKGFFYMGGVNGVSYFNADEIRPNIVLPKSVITGFTALNKNYELNADFSYLSEIELSYKEYFFSFEFSALEFTNPAKNKFKYMMEGFDNDWIDLDNRRFVTFTNLNPGTYYFKIKAANNDGVWNEAPTVVKLIVTPPFWRTYWFYTLCAIALFVGAYCYIKWREKKLIEEKIILEAAVEQRTDELKKEKELVEEKQKEILDSIRYAKRIQNSLLPTQKYIEKSINKLKNK